MDSPVITEVISLKEPLEEVPIEPVVDVDALFEQVRHLNVLIAIPLIRKQAPSDWPYQRQVTEAVHQAAKGLTYTFKTYKVDLFGYEAMVKAHQLIEQEAKRGYDRVLIMDGDVIPAREDFLRLLSHDVDVAYGLLTCHDIPERVMAGLFWRDENGRLRFTPTPRADLEHQLTTGWVWAGSGIMAVNTRVFQSVGFHGDYVEHYGEDILFCHEVQAQGFTVLLDGYVIPLHLPKVRD